MFSATLGSACAQEDDAAQLHEPCRKHSAKLMSRRAMLSFAGVNSLQVIKAVHSPGGHVLSRSLLNSHLFVLLKAENSIQPNCCCSLD